MSKKANPTTIGLFFVVGVALAIGAVVLFSSRSLFHPKKYYILYFEGSLKGLNPGAPVTFRGVTVGTVADIRIRHNQAPNDHSMPVIIAVDKKLVQSKSDEVLQFSSGRAEELIKAGYRARLDAESLVTGVLYVELDLLPDAPPPVFHQVKPEFEEIPTMPNTVQQLLANLAHFDVPGISDKLTDILGRLDQSLGQLNMAEINAGVTNLLTSANRVVGSADLTNSLMTLRQTLDDTSTLVRRLDNRVTLLADGATNTLSDVQKAVGELRLAIQNVSDLLGPDAGVPSDLRKTLQDLSNASRAVADLASFLERNPNALLTGKQRTKETP